MRRLSVAGCSALHLLLFLPADHTLGTNRGPDLLLPFFLYGCRGQSGSSQSDFFIFLRTIWTVFQENRPRLTDEYPECLAESGIDRFSHKDRESCRRRRPMRSCADARGRRSCPDAYPLAK